MISSLGLEQLMLQAVREVLHDNMHLVRHFAAALEDLTNEILSRLPRDDWRTALDAFFREWEQRGIRANPDSISILKQIIAEREQLMIAGGAATNDDAGSLRLDVTSSSETPRRAIKPIHLDPAAQASYEAIQRAQEARALETLGRAIMASHPPEKWLEYATRDASKVALSQIVRERFLQWIAAEQASAVARGAAERAIRSLPTLSRFDQRIGALQTEMKRLKESLDAFASSLEAQSSQSEIEIDLFVDKVIQGLESYNKHLIAALQAWPTESNKYEDLDRLRALPTPAGLGLPLHATNELAEQELAEWRKLQAASSAHERLLGRAELALHVADWTATAATVILSAGAIIAVKEGGKRVLVKLAVTTAAGMAIEAGLEHAARRAGVSEEAIAGVKLAAAIVSYIICKRRSGGAFNEFEQISKKRPNLRNARTDPHVRLEEPELTEWDLRYAERKQARIDANENSTGTNPAEQELTLYDDPELKLEDSTTRLPADVSIAQAHAALAEEQISSEAVKPLRQRHRLPKLKPGPFARESIPASRSTSANTAEQRKITEIGRKYGCHTCGTKDPGTSSGLFVPDHQPPSALLLPGMPQRLYPHCKKCSTSQGGQASAWTR